MIMKSNERLEMSRIVIIDTGVDIHSKALKDYTSEICGIEITKSQCGGFDVIETSKDLSCIYDDIGHGTAITGIILSHNPDASLFFVKLFNQNNLITDEDTLVFALEYVYDNVEFDIVNLSLGLCSLDNNQALKNICEKYTANGKYIISAFDNCGSISFPAAFDNVIGVTSNDEIFLNNEYYYVCDDMVNICAMGRRQKVYWNNLSQIFSSGNSYACAHFTGIISKYPKFESFDKLRQFLYTNASKQIEFEDKNRKQLNNPVSKYNRVIAFPFSKEVHSLVRFCDHLNFQLIDIYDTKYSARVGVSTNWILKETLSHDYIIKNVENIEWASFDTIVLGHLDEIDALLGVDFKKNLIKTIIKHDKNIYSFDNIENCCEAENLDNIYFPSVTDDNCSFIPFGKLYRQDKPVLAVFGTSSKQGKFTLQLYLRYELIKRGFKLFQMGTEPSALLYGMDAVYPTGYNSTVSISGIEAISHINKIMYEQSREADLILVGGQSGILPLDEGNLNSYNYSAIDMLLSTLPDAVVLCVNPFDNINFIQRTIKFIESIANCKVLALTVYPYHFLDSDVTQQLLVKLSEQQYEILYKHKFEEAFSLPVILPLDDSSIKEICDLIESYFSS